MVQKRPLRDHQADSRGSKRNSFITTLLGDLTKGSLFNEAVWERFFQRVVREEVEKAVSDKFNIPPSSDPGRPAGQSGLELRFISKLPRRIFTGSRIEPEDLAVLQIVLVDTVSQSIVKTGPLSSVKVEIVVLNGEFASDDPEDWTAKQFSDSILQQREGRRPLVTGDLTVTLCEGVGILNNVVFTDNSSWIRTRKFRLGARVVQVLPGDLRVKEAASEAFVVKDHRGELYQKHHPPCLKDEVWRLEKIAKDGAFHKRLRKSGITTVKEFLQHCMRNPSKLREILGKVSSRIWNTIFDHAMECVVDDNKLFTYHQIEYDVIVLFNSIYKVVGASFKGQFLPINSLTPSQKLIVENLKLTAYKNINHLVEVDAPSIPGPSRPLAEHYNDPNLALLNRKSTARDTNGLATQPNNNPRHVLPQTNRNPSFSSDDFLPTQFSLEPGWLAANTSQTPPLVQTNHFMPENLFHFQGSIAPSPGWTDPISSFIFGSNNEAAEPGLFPGLLHVSRDRRGKARWLKIRTAFKFRNVMDAARRMSHRQLYLGY